MGGAKYVAELLRTFAAYPNGVELAVAGYNAGPNAVKKAGYRIPQNRETPGYVAKVMGYLSASGAGNMEQMVPLPESGGNTEAGPGDQ